MTPKGAYFANIAAVCAAFAVSFVVSAFLLKTSKVKEDDDLEAATRRMQEMKSQSKGGAAAPASVDGDLSTVRKIIVACDAGMGSSAMGAGVLRKKVADAGLKNISVTNSAINSLPDDVDLVITHRDLTERAMRRAAGPAHLADQLPRQQAVQRSGRSLAGGQQNQRQPAEGAGRAGRQLRSR